VGVAVGSVVQGRLMDRLGPTRPLLTAIGLFSVFVTLSVLAVESHAAMAVMVPLAFAVGFTEPMVGSASRALWSRMVPAGSTRLAGYAYEAISMEVFFILGPGLSGLLVAAPWAGTGVVAGAVCMVIGGAWFALNPTVRGIRPIASGGGKLLGALASPGMRTVALAALGFGVTIGFIEVAVPAAAANAGHVGLGGLLLSVWSISSVIFGVLYAMRPFPKSMHLRLPALLGGFAALSLLLSIPTTLIWLGAVMMLVGTLVTPQATTHSAALEQVAPKGTATEAFGWVVTAVTVGLAIGQSISGYLVEHVGTPSAFLAAGGSGLLIAALVFVFRGTVAAGAPDGGDDDSVVVSRAEMDLAAR
jgi:hypothetical protein